MRALVTLSFDDGDDRDLGIADTLAEYNLQATFYVASDRIGSQVSWSTLRTLLAMGHEIGSHTVSHLDVHKATKDVFRQECKASKDVLEQGLGVPVTSFCYPFGHFKRRWKHVPQEAGFTYCRTSQAFATGRDFDPLLAPVTLQLFPHPRSVHVRHAAREANQHLLRSSRLLLRSPEPQSLVGTLAKRAQAMNGVMHLWGHAEEIARCELQGFFEDCCRIVADGGLDAGTNARIIEH